MAETSESITKTRSYVEKEKEDNDEFVEKDHKGEDHEAVEKEKDRDHEFPYGMRVMAVDDDIVCLKLLKALLLNCDYKVTAVQHAVTALQLLRENRENYDLVITDVRMPEMDGFKLLEIIGLEMDLPVIMLSSDGEVSTVMEGISHGARDYLLKPVRLEELKIIWKHVIKKSRQVTNPGADILKSEEKSKVPKRQNDEIYDDFDDEHIKQKKSKSRVNWSKKLHAKFVFVANQVGMDRIGPKKILELMNEPGLTRDNVASHLQKYRLALKKAEKARGQCPGASGSNESYGTNTSNPLGLSFANQSQNVSSSIKVEGFDQSCGTSQHMTSSWPSQHSLLQNKQRQQCLPATQASQSRSRSCEYTPNYLLMKTMAPQSNIHPSSWPSIPTPNQPYDHLESSQPPRTIVQHHHDQQFNVGSGVNLHMRPQTNGDSMSGRHEELEECSFMEMMNEPYGQMESVLSPRTFDQNSASSSVIQPIYAPPERRNTLFDSNDSTQVGFGNNNLVFPVQYQPNVGISAYLPNNEDSVTAIQKEFEKCKLMESIEQHYGHMEISLPPWTIDKNSASSSVIQPTYASQGKMNTLFDSADSPQVGLKDSNFVDPNLLLIDQTNGDSDTDIQQEKCSFMELIDESFLFTSPYQQ